MEDLKKRLAELKTLYLEKPPHFNPDRAEPKELEKLVKKLEDKFGSFESLKPPETVALDELYRKASINYQKGTNDFSPRERKNLPYILFHGDKDYSLFECILDRYVDLKNVRTIKRLLYVFFMHYDDSQKTVRLGQKLHGYFATASELSNSRLESARKCREILFGDYNVICRCMSELYSTKGIGLEKALQGVGIQDEILKGGNFVIDTLKYLFEKYDDIEAKYEVFQEICENCKSGASVNPIGGDDWGGYGRIKPIAVSNLIVLTQERLRGEKQKAWKYKLIRFCQKNFGDPHAQKRKWLGIEKEAKKIYLGWLVGEYLGLLFDIFKDTADREMWAERDRFWRAYLPHMEQIWLFLGSEAQISARRIAREKDYPLPYGKIEIYGGATPLQSAFMFELGGYIFCEGSHNWALRVWDRHTGAPIEFGDDRLIKQRLTNSGLVRFVHRDYWQGKVSAWIKDNCGIEKPDWSKEHSWDRRED